MHVFTRAVVPMVFLVYLVIALSPLLALSLSSCRKMADVEGMTANGDVKGGEDSLEVDMPFSEGYMSRCVQGANGTYSHHYTSTRYDVDFDTPNSADDPVFAPIGGVAYVHDADRTKNFGVHVNIDQGDGTYVILAHMDDVFVENGSEVAAGELLGFEGTTGASTGDHVHMGRHEGDATRDGIYGASVEGLDIDMIDHALGYAVDALTSDMTCDLTAGHVYESENLTPLWHPNGTLVKSPSSSTVYLLEGGQKRAFANESAFTSRNYDFADIALVSDDELACYNAGVAISADAGDASSVAATFKDGTLVSKVGDSAVYVMSDGIAMPIETWDAYLFMGFWPREVVEVSEDEFNAGVRTKGDCTTNMYCVSRSDVETCGGPKGASEGTYDSSGSGGEENPPVDTGTVTSDPPEEDGTAATDFALTWTTPGGALANSITLSGEYTLANGTSLGWKTLGAAVNATSVGYKVSGASLGDALRFSVEYVSGGVTSWSCLAPYPPGTVKGTATAVFDGRTLEVNAADDPSSDGCGLRVVVA